MKEFEYKINDPIGIHARPAGLIVKMCKAFECNVTISKGSKTIQGSKLTALMGLGVKQGDIVKVIADGVGEESAIVDLLKFFNENL
ncbi:MAG: HPr family phosphocarrier protein [Treponema sp.]|nr:HPr family phosphocarrier protein [Treponema sp.]